MRKFPHPSDLPMIVPPGMKSCAIISRATGGIRWVKRPYIPAPWCPRPPREHRAGAYIGGEWVPDYTTFGRKPPKWRPRELPADLIRDIQSGEYMGTIDRFTDWNN